MKKLIVSLLAVAGMVACSNEHVVRQQAGEAIGFSGAFVENATRAEAEDPSIKTTTLDAFRVWAFMDEVTGEVLNGELVTKEGSFWFYKNVQYWMPGHTYYFAALAPVEGNWALNTNKEDGEYIANEHGAGIVDFTNVDGSEDLLYAATVRENSVLNGNAPVQLQFNHLLSKIKFTFVNGFTTENVDVEVKNVTMTAPASGSIDLAVENWLDNSDWVDLADGLTLEFGDVVRLDHGQSASAADERLTIPASAEREYVVNFDVVVYYGGVYSDGVCSGGVATEFAKTATITGIPFEMGKAYNLKATIGPETLNLEEIVFEVEKVNEWNYVVDDYEFGFTDREESEEPETPEPEQPGDVTELTIVSHGFGFTGEMETEVIFMESADRQHVVDFRMTGIEAGSYNGADGGISLEYSLYMQGSSEHDGGVVMSSANATIVDNGDTTFTFDVTFVAEGATYHFTYTTPAEEVEESGNTVKLVSKSAGEQIGSYAYGCLLKDADGNNQVKIAVDVYFSWDTVLDFPKANEYTTFQSSPTYIGSSSQFSFVNKSLKVNGVTYANSDVSNAKMTVVEATSITIEFTVGGEDYKFVYSI